MTEQATTTFAKLRMPIEVIGSDLGGRQFIESAHTLTIHRGGATVQLSNKLGPDSEVIIHNLNTGVEANARVVGQIRKEFESHVYAVAFLEPDVDLWHMHFPEGAPPSLVALECSRCHNVSEHPLSEIEMEVFSVRRDLTLNCKTCHSSTIWKETTRKPTENVKPQPAEPKQKPAGVQGQKSRGEELRKDRRTTLRAPVCIRCSSQEAIVSCEDISRGGFRFVSRNQYPEGTHLEAAVPYTESGNNIFTRAVIVFCSKTPDGRFRHGVTYMKSKIPAHQR